MSSTIPRIPSKFLRSLALPADPLHRDAGEQFPEKAERIAEELLNLNKLERHDYAILFRHKMGFHRYGPAPTGPAPKSDSSAGSVPAAVAVKEKTAFDVKLEKFDASAKLKVIKEITAFTDLGMKKAKDLVEKAPAVLKKGVTKEEGHKIMEKLKEVGATVILESSCSYSSCFCCSTCCALRSSWLQE